MKTQIFYFSGTGNSFVVARDMARILEAELMSIPKAVLSQKIQIEADCIGIVFPSYLAVISGLPLIVVRFVRKIANIASLHIFAVCTCGGYEAVNALPSLHGLKRIVQLCGGTLLEEYSIRLPMNNLDYAFTPPCMTTDHEVMFTRGRAKVEGICQRIMTGKGTKGRTAKTLFRLLMAPTYAMMRKPVLNVIRQKAKEPIRENQRYEDMVPFTDRSIVVGANCTGCGICAKVCPAGNIRIIAGKPEFQHKCEMCFSCDEWCPSNAIHHWSRREGVKYHHPETALSDMLQ